MHPLPLGEGRVRVSGLSKSGAPPPPRQPAGCRGALSQREWDSRAVIDRAYSCDVPSEFEDDTEAVFEEIQILVCGLHRLVGDGGGNVKTDTRQRIAPYIESHATRTGGKNLHTTAVVDGELRTDIADSLDQRGI